MVFKKSSITDLIEQAESLTPEKLELVKGVLKVQQSRTVFRFLMCAFPILCIVFIASFFWTPCDELSAWSKGGWIARSLLGTITGIIGLGFRAVYKSL